MPNLNFYAFGADHVAVLNAVVELGGLRLFEAYSEPGEQVREFARGADVPPSSHGAHLMLSVVGAAPAPIFTPTGPPATRGDTATRRYRPQGWGLIQLYFGSLFGDHELRWSHTNHDTIRRAQRWAAITPELGDPTQCDWTAVTNRHPRRTSLRVARGRPTGG